MTPKYTFKKATPADAAVVAKIYLASRKAFVSFAPLVHSDASVYSWILEVLIPADGVFILEEDGLAVGMMSLSKKHGVGWIDQLYLMPAAVGHGIGTLLISEAKSILGSPIRLFTFQKNFGARRFYERHAFQIVEFTDGSSNEEKCPDMIYEWRV